VSGVESNQLGFIRESTVTDFALQLVNYLDETGNKEAFCKICKELEIIFQRSKYTTSLENIKFKLNCN
jgi:hypothetical protein